MRDSTDEQLSGELEHLVRQGDIIGYAFDRYWRDTVWTVVTPNETWTLESYALRLILDARSFNQPT